jgi:hypothetical protein
MRPFPQFSILRNLPIELVDKTGKSEGCEGNKKPFRTSLNKNPRRCAGDS